MYLRTLPDNMIRHCVRLIATLYVMTSLSDAVSINVVTVPQNDLTCWTCPNKTNNEACNNWAPDINCPKNFTWCMSIHRVDVLKGRSLTVQKKCALPAACTKEAIGCRETGEEGVQECTSCCNVAYCNEAIPFNQSAAVQLSTIMTSSSPANHRPSYITILTCLITAFLLVISQCCRGNQLFDLATSFAQLLGFVAMATALLFCDCLSLPWRHLLKLSSNTQLTVPGNQGLLLPSNHFMNKSVPWKQPETPLSSKTSLRTLKWRNLDKRQTTMIS